MINVTFVYNGSINNYPSWVGYDGTTLLTIAWNGLYWEMLGWPYDGEPRNYNNTLNPTTGWALYNNTTLTATFDVVLGACPLPTPSPTATPSITPTPSPTIGISRTPTPTPSPSQTCNTPVLNNVTLIGSHAGEYTFGLFFTPTSTCGNMIYEYSCDGISWTSCGYEECADGFGCISPVQVTISSLYGCVVCSGNWYFRLKQCCGNLQSNYSNTVVFVPVSTSPSPTPSITKTPSRTPSITPSISITPTKTPTPSLTPTPTPSPSFGTCKYLQAVQTTAKRFNIVTVQYTNCAGALSTFDINVPVGTNVELNLSELNICLLTGTFLTVIGGLATISNIIYGNACSSPPPPPPPPKLCKIIKAIKTRIKGDATTGIVQYINCAGMLSTFEVNLTYGTQTINITSLNICAQVNTPVSIIAGDNVYLVTPSYGDECASTPPKTTLVKLPFGFSANDACYGNNTNYWCLDYPDLCTATILYLSDGTSCLSVVTEGLWLSDGINVRYWNGSSFEGCGLC
jgi:hypothetical protein